MAFLGGDRTVLDDTSLLLPRWLQEGSTIKNVFSTVTADKEVTTVTSGKTYYVQSILVAFNSTDTAQLTLKDGGVAGNPITQISQLGGRGNQIIVFDPPIKFLTDIYCDTSGATSVNLTLTGWEE